VNFGRSEKEMPRKTVFMKPNPTGNKIGNMENFQSK